VAPETALLRDELDGNPTHRKDNDNAMNASQRRRPSSAEIDALKRFAAATVYEAQSQTGALTSAIKPIDPTRRVAGRALTIDVLPGDNLMVHFALTQASPGDVLVINGHGDTECALWGDILTLAAKQAGVAGVIIDGAVRDTEAIIALGFPVFARGVSIRGPQKKASGHINVPIVCGGATVHPGDIVLGDRDGIVVVPESNLDQVLATALKREEAEASLRQRISSGQTTVELLNLKTTLARHGLA
jgi:4-hydroxy-4-methyl-2-oxoglutarate aldolase